MTLNNDYDNFSAIARERQAHILKVGGSSDGRRPGSLWSVGVALAVVCAPLAAIFFLRMW